MEGKEPAHRANFDRFNKLHFLFQTARGRIGTFRRGSKLPYGESMEISAAALARAKTVAQERNGSSVRRDSTLNTKNGAQKVNNNNDVNSVV